MSHKKVVVVFLSLAALFFSSCESGGIITPEGFDEKDGWQVLYDGKDMSKWGFKEEQWVNKNGVLATNAGQEMCTKERFGDFVLDLDFKLSKKADSGVYVRFDAIRMGKPQGPQIQLNDSYGKKTLTKTDCGGIYQCLEPGMNMVKKPGEWNHCRIMCKENKIYVEINGKQTAEMDVDLWTEPEKNPDGTTNMLSTAYKDLTRVGHIGLQNSNRRVWYDNIRIKPLKD